MSQTCTYCVMDSTEPTLVFDALGRCNLCREMESQLGTTWFLDSGGETLLQRELEQMQSRRKKSGYDCILGLSGGVDSSYVALKLHDWGMRPLVVHVDAGWNSELAVRNIEVLLNYTKWDLHTHVVNWESMRRLQIAYLKSGVSNQDVPQDHAYFASLYKFAVDNSINHVILGGNVATEGIFPPSWHHAAMDATSIRAIWDRFGDGGALDYPLVGFFKYFFYYPRVKGLTTFRPLNYVPYRKTSAETELQERIEFRPYARKHGESVFTRFFQNFYLPNRFGFDKRRPHLSSMIVSGQMTRSEALMRLDEPLYDVDELQRDRDYLTRKLRISDIEFASYLKAPLRTADEFPNWNRRWRAMKQAQAVAEWGTKRNLGLYR